MKIKIFFFSLFTLLLLWFFSWLVPNLVSMNKESNSSNKSGSILAQISYSSYDALDLSTAVEKLKNIGRDFIVAMPYFVKRIWSEIHNLIIRLWGYIKNIWFSYMQPFLEDIWIKVKNPLSSEVKERKVIIKEEFRSEKEGLIKEIKDILSRINIPFKGIIEKVIR